MTKDPKKVNWDAKIRSLASRIFKPQDEADRDLMGVAIVFFLLGYLIGG